MGKMYFYFPPSELETTRGGGGTLNNRGEHLWMGDENAFFVALPTAMLFGCVK